LKTRASHILQIRSEGFMAPSEPARYGGRTARCEERLAALTKAIDALRDAWQM